MVNMRKNAEKRLITTRFIAVMLSFVMAVGVFVMMPERAEAAGRKRYQIRQIEIYEWHPDTREWVRADKGGGAGKVALAYNKRGNLKSIKTNFRGMSHTYKYTYKYRKNKKIKSSTTSYKTEYDSAKYKNTYNKKGYRTKTEGPEDKCTFQYKKGYASKKTTFSYESITGTSTFKAKTKKGLLKSATKKSVFDEETYTDKYWFNGNGLVKKHTHKGTGLNESMTVKYKYNKNGSVKQAVITQGSMKTKQVFRYNKRAISKKKYAAVINWSVLGSLDAIWNEWLLPVI